MTPQDPWADVSEDPSMFQDVWEVVMAVKPMAESGYLKALCFCIDRRDCWHGPCQVLRLRFGRVLLENGAGYVRLPRTVEVTLKAAAGAQKGD